MCANHFWNATRMCSYFHHPSDEGKQFMICCRQTAQKESSSRRECWSIPKWLSHTHHVDALCWTLFLPIFFPKKYHQKLQSRKYERETQRKNSAMAQKACCGARSSPSWFDFWSRQNTTLIFSEATSRADSEICCQAFGRILIVLSSQIQRKYKQKYNELFLQKRQF